MTFLSGAKEVRRLLLVLVLNLCHTLFIRPVSDNRLQPFDQSYDHLCTALQFKAKSRCSGVGFACLICKKKSRIFQRIFDVHMPNSQSQPNKPSQFTAMHLAIGSIVIALMVLALKYSAYLLTNSVGLYSDALETVVNLTAGIGVVAAVWMSEKPADHNHPFGHHKAEYLSAVAEGVFVLLAAFSIFREAYDGLVNPQPLDANWLGMSLNAGAGLLNGLWAYMLINHGKRLRSPALIADGRHLYTDIISSIGVLAGVVIAIWTGLYWLDSLLAFAIALSILWTGWQLLKGSFSGLMDEAIDEEEQDQIRDIIIANAFGAIEAHDLRTRHSGPVIFVEFHLVVPSAMTVHAAHAICDRIEHALMDSLPYANVIIHIEPEDMAHAPQSDGSMVF